MIKNLTAYRLSAPLVLTAAAAILLSACAIIPSESGTQPQRDAAGAQLAADIKLAREGWPAARWWEQYNDPQLSALIDTALKDGPSVATAAARVKTAQASLAGQHANDGLNVGVEAAYDRHYYSANGLFPPPLGGNWITESQLIAKASYDFDIWGRHRAAIAGAVGEVNATRADAAQAEQGLAASVAQTYYKLQADWARLDVLRNQAKLQASLSELRKKRVDRGLDPITVRESVQGDQAQLARQIAAIETQAGQDREALRALIGGDAKALGNLTPRPLPNQDGALPKELGFELLARRADLQAARWRVEASLSKIESAKAAFYPEINIGGSFGFDTLEAGKLLDWTSHTASLLPSISLPIFDNGRLSAQLGTQRAKRDEAIADYNQAIVNAVRDVAQQAVAIRGLENQIKAQADSQKSAQALQTAAQSRLKIGLVDRSAVIQAQLAVATQQDTALQLQQARLDSEIALIKALGGGYHAPAATRPAAD
ncbi:efflux transporter outer membrane subunit [Andreprevotia chitinilytica]|uniref:efflux transporter outer membrane subunit n=1 Tax=Andreprevotia chitinilytica TaxID=396808 RepID=UPI00068A5466|nr:efflux transporter outer membrane subunit [Andreprevotia chitinilytica]